MRLVKVVFDKLLADLLAKFKADCEKNGLKAPIQKGKLYGYAYQKPTNSPNLVDAINKDPAVQKYFVANARIQDKDKVPRKHLYNLERAFYEKDRHGDLDEAETKAIYIDAYTVYLEYTGFEAYLTEPGQFEAQVIEAQRIRLQNSPEALTRLATVYMGYYYSYRQYRIKTLELSIDFVNGANNRYPATLRGFHDQEGTHQDIKYRGYASRRATDYLMVELEGENSYPLTLLGHIGGKSIPDCKIIFTAMQGLSVNAYPISLEVVLLKQEMAENGLRNVAKGKLENLYLYLQLQRRNFRVPNRMIPSLDYLRARRNDVRKFTTALKGSYRLWNYSKSGNIIQSRFTIEDNFCGFLETIPDYINEKKQVSLMSISNARDNKLCVSTHEEIGISVINFFILDIGNTKNNLMEGVFASIGPKELGVLADYLVAMKDNSEFKAMEIKREKMATYIKQNPKVGGLKDRLYQLSKEKRKGVTFIE